jgi:mono/diheme cytochrome c family protein
MKRTRLFAIFAGLTAAAALPLAAAEPAPPVIDPATGMKVAEGWELVRVHCTVCHSPQQYLRQKGTAGTWTDTIRWMQKSGGLWPLDAATEGKIVSYLATNYGPVPGEHFRRAPIAGTLLPPNPYASEARREFEEKKKAGLIPAAPPKP